MAPACAPPRSLKRPGGLPHTPAGTDHPFSRKALAFTASRRGHGSIPCCRAASLPLKGTRSCATHP